MPNAPLDVLDHLAGAALIPVAVQLFCDSAELDEEVLTKILDVKFSALLPPKANELPFVVAHDDTSVRTTDETPPLIKSLQ
jgi:hypothetical protein